MRVSMFVGAVLAAALVAACGGGPAVSPAGRTPVAPTPGAGSPAAPPGGGGASSVSIIDFAFEPAALNVSVGTTVTWVNDGQQPHTVDWEDDEPESPDLATGDEYERTFATAGTFNYVCGIHPQMTGSVTVGQ